MRKIISSILITVIMLANFLAPVSVGWNNGKFKIDKKEAKADYYYSLNIIPTRGDTYFSIDVEVVEGTSVNESTIAGLSAITASLQVKATVYDTEENKKINDDTEYFGSAIKKVTLNLGSSNLVSLNRLNPDTPYKILVELKERVDTQTNQGIAGSYGGSDLKTLYTKELNLKTIPEDESPVVEQEVNISGTSDTLKEPNFSESFMPVCGIGIGPGEGTIGGCVAQVLYYLFFVPTSALFALAGTFFDNVFAYSVNDASYRSAFVVEGWKVVRDFCNMFFIFVLLYIAFQTILNINGSKTKEMIINVVIIGLLINFSLFATRVIIDASNILARVFYNSNTIQITALDKDGSGNEVTDTIAKMNKTGVLPLSSALVNKVNPQALIINADKMNDIPDTAHQIDPSQETESKNGVSTWTFILVTLLASAINIIGFIVFLTVGLMFVVRVVGLWLAMIIAPFAFFSYTVPKMQDIDMVGWKRWWPETLKLAFLAPVFIFFLYLILQFLETGLGIIDADNKKGLLNYGIAVFVPFAFIMVLLTQAKKIAVKMAGQMGESVSKAGSAIGGLALGAVTGGAAMAMRGTIGKMGDKIANSSMLAKAESKGGASGFLAKMALKGGDKISKGSFDARKTKLGGMAANKLGVDLGKAKEGGFAKEKADKLETRTKRADELKKIASKPEEIKKRKLEVDKKLLEEKNSAETQKIEAGLTSARQEFLDAGNNEEARAIATEKMRILNEKKNKINSGTSMISEKDEKGEDKKDSNGNIIYKKNADGTNMYNTDNGKMSKTHYENLMSTEKRAFTNIDESRTAVKTAESETKEIADKAEKEYQEEKAKIDKKESSARSTSGGVITDKKIADEIKEARSLAEKKRDESIKMAKEKIEEAKNKEEKAKIEFDKIKKEADIARKDTNNGSETGNSISDFKMKIAKQENIVNSTKNEVASDYANWIGSNKNKIANIFSSGNTKEGYSEAADKIRLGIKTEGNIKGKDDKGQASILTPQKEPSKPENRS